MITCAALCRQLRDLDPTNEPETTRQIGREAATMIERLIGPRPVRENYRGWGIAQGRWPEPAWMATGPDYDASYEGEEDGWVDNGQKADAPTREALIAEIDEWFATQDPQS